MLAGKIAFSVCLVLATAQAAGAAQKDPVPGSVTCHCDCRSVDADGKGMNYPKTIGGPSAPWTQSRSACRAYSGATCAAKDQNGKTQVGELKNCDVIVHSERPDAQPQAPAADTLAPGTQGGGTNKLKLRLQPKLLTQ